MERAIDLSRIAERELVVITAHPDDETIGASVLLSRSPHATVVHVTDGAPRDLRDARVAGFSSREAYAAARRTERERALGIAGIDAEHIRDLGIVDQEAAYALVALTHRIAALVVELRAEAVLTHPYEGGHPDHDATAFAVHGAVHLLSRRGLAPPLLLEMTSYHERDGRMVVFEFLPDHVTESVSIPLSSGERARKAQMVSCYATQRGMLEAFPIALERYRLAPRYDFSSLPAGGTCYYERFDWGMTGARWLDLTRSALATLARDDKPCP